MASFIYIYIYILYMLIGLNNEGTIFSISKDGWEATHVIILMT